MNQAIKARVRDLGQDNGDCQGDGGEREEWVYAEEEQLELLENGIEE
jgi:hypothetical protein